MENDFVKLDRKIKLDEIINRLETPDARIITELSILLNELGLVKLMNNGLSSISTGIGFISLGCYVFAKKIKYERITYENNRCIEIRELLRTTKTYEECKKGYIDYIEKCNTFIEELNPNNLMEIIVLFQKLLQENYLCKDKKGSYNANAVPRHKFNTMFELDELLGCRVSTGAYSCRHISSLLNDILNSNSLLAKNGIHSFYTKVWITDDINRVGDYKKNDFPNHAIILFEKNGKYMGYCPTMNCFISLDEYINGTKSIRIKAYDVFDKSIRYYGFIPESYNNFDQDQIKSNILNTENLNKLSTLYMKKKEQIDNYDEDLFTSFYSETSKNLENMSEGINVMVPQKRKLKQLIIR